MVLVTETRSAFLACASVAVHLLGRPELAHAWALPSVHEGLRVRDVAAELVRGLRRAALESGSGARVPLVLHPTAATTADEARLLLALLARPGADGGFGGDPGDESLALLAGHLEDLALSVAQHVDVSPSTARAALELLVTSAHGASGGLGVLGDLSATLRGTPAVAPA
jgi:hypothetical protein